jgi:hypothetical protein
VIPNQDPALKMNADPDPGRTFKKIFKD